MFLLSFFFLLMFSFISHRVMLRSADHSSWRGKVLTAFNRLYNLACWMRASNCFCCFFYHALFARPIILYMCVGVCQINRALVYYSNILIGDTIQQIKKRFPIDQEQSFNIPTTNFHFVRKCSNLVLSSRKNVPKIQYIHLILSKTWSSVPRPQTSAERKPTINHLSAIHTLNFFFCVCLLLSFLFRSPTSFDIEQQRANNVLSVAYITTQTHSHIAHTHTHTTVSQHTQSHVTRWPDR